ncbi:MAG: GNAT family N-acetyltransferase [Candidatus Latescibacteria bacterium]|nr:GNAT family N-acetyltransferase [Candidatus Latescibacterota bacterium]
MDILLTTQRLSLRRFTAADTEHIYALDNDPEVMRFINGGTPTPRRVVEEEILPGFIHWDQGAPAYGFWAAEERDSGAFIGWFSLRPDKEEPQVIVLGYRLCRAVWGQGLATEGVRALIAKGFTELGVERMVASTYQDNTPSLRVMEKAGLKFVRSFRITVADMQQSDTYHVDTDEAEIWDGDDVEYALDRGEWRKRS